MVMIIGYAYEADEHCRKCAREKFTGHGSGEMDENGVPVDAIDDEGNTISPRFITDQVINDVYCGTCGDIIAEAT